MISGGGFAKPVALKVLNQEMGGMAEVAQRLRDEARLLGRLKHPAILRVDDLVQLEGCWTVVMELLVGANLHQIVRSSGPLPTGVALEIAHVVAGALHAAHDRPGPSGEPLRVLHRDIKPSNIQLTPLGEVKVLDFGVARASFATREAATRSLIFGSVGYMAPERMAGRDSHAGDVYALGVVLYEILAGRRLGTACSQASLQTTMVEDALASLVEQHPDDQLHALLRSALAFEPEARPRADTFQRSARKLRARFPDPWLSDWTDTVLRQVMADEDEGTGPLSGRVLHERGGAEEPVAPTRGQPQRRSQGAAPFTPLPFEPSEPHTPTAGQPAPWADDIPSEPIGLPPLPQPRSRPTPKRTTPTPAPTVPQPKIEKPDPEPTPEPSAQDPTRFERLATPPPSASTHQPLEEAGTAMEPVPSPAPEPPPTQRRKLPVVAIGTTAVVAVLGLVVLLGPVRSALQPAPADEPAIPMAPAEDPLPTATVGAEPVGAAGGATGESAAVGANGESVEVPEHSNEPVSAAVGAATEPAPAPQPPAVRDPEVSTPAVQPEPSSATAPQPEEAPAPVPEPEGPQPATVVLVGDATAISLEGVAGTHGPGQVPPGHYVIMASFPGLDAPVRAGELDLISGQTLRLYCQSGFDRCTVEGGEP